MEELSTASLSADEMKRAFREFILAPMFPCVAAKAAINGEVCSLEVYEELASLETTDALGRDLLSFIEHCRESPSDYCTFAAIFKGPTELNEAEFESLLWTQLRRLNRQDAEHFAWDPSVSPDPEDPHFAFSFGERAFFIVGLHSQSSREARRFAWPTLVFNFHEQFERLREQGRWERMQQTIRERDERLQGNINPMISDFGDGSEAKQYSGREVGEEWHAPFTPTPPKCPFSSMSTTASEQRQRLAPQTGTAFELKRGDLLRVIDPQGEQVSDLVAFNREDKKEWLSSGRSIDYANTIYLTTGHILYSNRSRPMFTLLRDDVGRHDFLLTPCSPETFSIIYNNREPHPSCFHNLHSNLARFGILPDDIPTTFNIFMNVVVLPSGELKIDPPRSLPGDVLELRAEMDMIVGLTACSAEMSNNYAFKPIEYEVVRGA